MKRFLAIQNSAWPVAILLLSAAAASAADWGNLKGRFVVDGAAPARAPLPPGNDQFCIGLKPLDETVMVGEKGGLANVAVYIVLPRAEKIDIHPDYAELATKPAVLDNKNCHFEPHVLTMRLNQPLVIKNSDPTGHSTMLESFNETIGKNEEVTKKLTRLQSTPLPVSCTIHTFMKGYVLLLDHPYMAASNDKGEFEIKNIPTGARGFTFWHEAPGYLRDIKVGSSLTDRRGKLDVTIKAGETVDLGEIRIPIAVLRSGS